MRKLTALIILILVMVSGCIKNHEIKKNIIVGLDISPIGYVDERGEVVGFEVDLAREAIKRAGSIPEFKIIKWSEKEQELNSRQIDLIWNGMDITPERKEIMLFSKPYMNNWYLTR